MEVSSAPHPLQSGLYDNALRLFLAGLSTVLFGKFNSRLPIVLSFLSAGDTDSSNGNGSTITPVVIVTIVVVVGLVMLASIGGYIFVVGVFLELDFTQMNLLNDG